MVVPTGTKAPYPTPGKGPANHDQGALLDTLPGSASGACVRVGGNSDVRSGGIGAGDFVSARSQYRTSTDRTVGLSIVPRHTAHLTRARIVVDPQGPGATRTVTSQAPQEGDADQYFDAVVPIDTAGSYRLTITSGSDRGCFLVTFTR